MLNDYLFNVLEPDSAGLDFEAREKPLPLVTGATQTQNLNPKTFSDSFFSK